MKSIAAILLVVVLVVWTRNVEMFTIPAVGIRRGPSNNNKSHCIRMPSSSSSSLFVGWKSSTNHGKFLTKTALSLSLRRGLEVRPTGGATPSEGGMTLYLKAGPVGTSSVGDCPFAHFVRMVLEEKGLDYELRPCGNDEDKPTWLLEHYEGKMPALRHGQECYIESDVIAQYLDFFFPNPNLALPKKKILKGSTRFGRRNFSSHCQVLEAFVQQR